MEEFASEWPAMTNNGKNGYLRKSRYAVEITGTAPQGQGDDLNSKSGTSINITRSLNLFEKSSDHC